MYIKENLKENLPQFLLEPLRQIYGDARYAVMHMVPEIWYIKRRFRKRVGYSLNLDNPRTFNEKLQWLKLHDRKPLYTRMVDKYEAKKYAAEIIGEEYIIPTLGVWDHFDEINFNQLPGSFVLKCTHDSGSVVICKDKKSFDKKAARKKLERGLRYNYYYADGFEWPYKNVKRKIIAEKFMVDETRTELKDYKVFNFNGEPKIIQVDYDRFVKHKRDMYSTDWEKLNYALIYATNPNHKVNRPKQLAKMLELARKLAKDHPFLRTDFYSIDDKLYFGEMTFFPESGFGKWLPEEVDRELGNCLNIQGGSREYILTIWIAKQQNPLTEFKRMSFNSRVKCGYMCTKRNRVKCITNRKLC